MRLARFPDALPAAARTLRISASIGRARSWTSTAPTRGLATVSIRFVVSPKSLMNWTGEAPLGSSGFSDASLSCRSSSSLSTSLTSSRRLMVTTAMPLRVFDSILSILAFSAIFVSSLRVMRSSIFSELAPGHATSATATRTGTSGSLRLGIAR